MKLSIWNIMGYGSGSYSKTKCSFEDEKSGIS